MKNYLVYIITAFCLSLLLVFVLVLPAFNNLSDLNEQVFEKEISLQSQQEYFWELEDVADRIKGQEESLEKINDADFKSNTSDFRNSFHHRIPPRIEFGITNIVRREKLESDKARYDFGYTDPLSLGKIIPSLKNQLDTSLNCYTVFQQLVDELVSQIK